MKTVRSGFTFLAAFFVLWMALVGVWSTASVAFAQEVAAPAAAQVVAAAPAAPAAETLGHQIITMIAGAVSLLLTGLVAKILMAFERKLKVDVPDPTEQKIYAALDKGIHYAEEQSHKALKTNAQKLQMSDTLEQAAKFIVNTSAEKKLVAMGQDKLKQMIEMRLNMKRTANLPPKNTGASA